jgi:uncharacterized repeat protein (TIGR02543 family)
LTCFLAFLLTFALIPVSVVAQETKEREGVPDATQGTVIDDVKEDPVAATPEPPEEEVKSPDNPANEQAPPDSIEEEPISVDIPAEESKEPDGSADAPLIDVDANTNANTGDGADEANTDSAPSVATESEDLEVATPVLPEKQDTSLVPEKPNEQKVATSTLIPLSVPTPYRIIYWVEKPGLDHDPVPGTASDYIYSTSRSATGMLGETVTVGAADIPANASLGIDNPMRYAEFQTSDSVEIAEDGLTVVNVYCKLRIYTVTFAITDSTLYFIYPRGGGTTYGPSQPGGNYRIQVKYGQDVSNIWPSQVTADFPTQTSGNGASEARYYGWVSAETNGVDPTVSAIDTRTHVRVMTGAYMPKNPSIGNYTYQEGKDLASGLIHARFYVEALADENLSGTTTVVWDNKTYVLMPEYSQDAVQAIYSNRVKIPGLKPANFNYTNSTSFQGICWSFEEGDKFREQSSGEYMTIDGQRVMQQPWYEHIFFVYEDYTLSYDTQGRGTTPAPRSVQYGSSLTSFQVNPNPVSGYQFGGWYVDAACKTPFSFAGTMPARDVTVFAKWVTPTLTVDQKDLVVIKGIPQTVTFETTLPDGGTLSNVIPEVLINSNFLSLAPFTVEVRTGDGTYVDFKQWSLGGFLLQSSKLTLRITALNIASSGVYDYAVKLRSGGTLIAKCTGSIKVLSEVVIPAPFELSLATNNLLTRVYGESFATDNEIASAVLKDMRAYLAETYGSTIDLGKLKLAVRINSVGADRNAGTHYYSQSNGRLEIDYDSDAFIVTGLSNVVATLNIAPRPITITVNNASKVFGAPNPTFTGSITSGSLVNAGDLGTISFVFRGGSEAVGTYAGGLTTTYTANPNYAVTVIPGTFTITAPSDTPVELPTTPTTPSTPPATPSATTGAPTTPTVPTPTAMGSPAASAMTTAGSATSIIEDAAAPLAAEPSRATGAAESNSASDGTVGITDNPTPLASGESTEQWVLLNLLLALISVMFAFVLAVHFFVGRRRDEEHHEVNAKSDGNIWRILAIGLGIASGVVFVLTEDLTLPMGIADAWSPLMVFFVVAQVALVLVMWQVRRHGKNGLDRKASFPV